MITSTLRADRRKSTASVLMVFVLIAILCLKPCAASINFISVKKYVHLSLEKIFNVAVKKELFELRRSYFTVIQMWECEWWGWYKTTANDKQHVWDHFPHRRSLTEYQLLEEMKNGKNSECLQCYIEVPRKLRASSARISVPIFNNISVSKKKKKTWWKTMPKQKKSVLILENVHMKLQVTKRNTDHFSAIVLFATWAGATNKLSFWKQCKKLFQQLCAVISGRSKKMWRESKLQYSRRDHEIHDQ